MTPARLTLLLSGPVFIGLGSWIYLSVMIGDMSKIPGIASMTMAPQVFDPMMLFGLFVMWSVMMAAMMLPTATPMILAYVRMQAPDRDHGAGWLPVMMFCSGYIVAWAGFSLAAATLQAGLTNFAMMSPMMMKAVTGPLAAGILVAAGLYQFTPLKQSCLHQCRTPLSFLMTQWRDGRLGALSMGWRHGLFCVGCCWVLMGLLFVVGVMNTGWIIAITLYVLVEKTVPGSKQISKLLGGIMTGVGLAWFLT